MSDTERNYFDMIDDTLRHRADRAERILSALLSGFERRGLLPEGREPLAEEVIEAVAQVFERLERAERILAALREPSANVIESANVAFPFAAPMIRAAVAAAEREVDA